MTPESPLRLIHTLIRRFPEKTKFQSIPETRNQPNQQESIPIVVVVVVVVVSVRQFPSLYRYSGEFTAISLAKRHRVDRRKERKETDRNGNRKSILKVVRNLLEKVVRIFLNKNNFLRYFDVKIVYKFSSILDLRRIFY